jgi:hypothetical protein
MEFFYQMWLNEKMEWVCCETGVEKQTHPACENKNMYFLRRETIWGCVQWKRTCYSSWTSSSASHKSQVGEGGEVEFQVASCFKAKGVDTKSETSHTVNDISREVKKHVPGKPIRRMGKQRSLCRQCTPLVISVLLLRSIGWLLEKGVQNSKFLSLRSTTNRLRSIGSHISNFCLIM